MRRRREAMEEERKERESWVQVRSREATMGESITGPVLSCSPGFLSHQLHLQFFDIYSVFHSRILADCSWSH